MSDLLFDIGGTHTRLAIKEGREDFSEPIMFDTPEDVNKAMSVWENKVDKLKQKNNIKNLEKAIGGIPGTLGKGEGVLKRSPNLPGWENEKIRSLLEESLQAEVYLFNDADMVGLGEAVYGAGKEADIVAYITISTGIGGTRIIDGDIDRHALGFEPGHQYLLNVGEGNLDDLRDFEYLASGSGIRDRYGKDPKELDQEIYNTEITKYIAVGVHNTILHWSPDRVVLGGAVMLNDVDIKEVEKQVDKIMNIFYKLPDFKLAKFEDYGGLYGALAYSHKLS